MLFHPCFLSEAKSGSTWLVIKKQTNAEIKAVMSPLQEAYSCTWFLSYFLPLPSVSESQYSWSCLGGSGAQCSPLCFQQCWGLRAVPLCLWLVCGLPEQLCVQAVLFGTVLNPWHSAQPLLCAQKQLGVAHKALPALRRGGLICATRVLFTSLRGTWVCFHLCDTEQDIL